MNHDLIREEVWYALSELYLDEDVDELRQQHIASILAQSGYAIDELEDILFQEVHPALCWNIMQVAGHWGDFGRQWTVETVLSHINRPAPNTWWQRLHAKGINQVQVRLQPIIHSYWRLIKSRIEALRSQG
jgi:hypothetical protein